MKTIILAVTILIAISLHCEAQSTNKNYLSNRYLLERMGTVGTSSNSVLPGLPMAPPDVVGDPFSKPNFSLTSAILYNDQMIDGIYSKYDLLSGHFYFLTKQGLRVMAGQQVKSFIFIDSLYQKKSIYINANEFKSDIGIPYKGFFEILFDGEMALLRKTEAIVRKANYHVALSVGSQNHKIDKKTDYYYLVNDVVALLPSSKKLSSIFGDKKSAIDKFIKINQLNLKDGRHLTLIFEHYNQNLTKK